LHLTGVEVTDPDADGVHRLRVVTLRDGSERRTEMGPLPPESSVFRQLVSELSSALPLPLVLSGGGTSIHGWRQLLALVLQGARKGCEIQRYKGLGEMNADQLWDTTMDPSRRTLVKVKVDNPGQADEIFSVLMGDSVDPRRNFIQNNALNVRNLDV
jgi:DNA gyrase subunit B